MTDAEEGSSTEVDRREALKKVAGFGAVAGAVWAAPAVNGLSVVPGYAAAQSDPTTSTTVPAQSIVATGTATKSLGCFSGAIGDDTFLIDLGDDGWWHFFFQGCSLGSSESVALHDPPGGPFGDAYHPPTGYRCKMELLSGSTVVYDTGYVSNPINGIADTGGVIFISTGQYPNGHGNMNWRITCDPL